jgi:hypothetical protein
VNEQTKNNENIKDKRQTMNGENPLSCELDADFGFPVNWACSYSMPEASPDAKSESASPVTNSELLAPG